MTTTTTTTSVGSVGIKNIKRSLNDEMDVEPSLNVIIFNFINPRTNFTSPSSHFSSPREKREKKAENAKENMKICLF